MSIPAGTRLGPYEIIESIGAGGMGEVYRARDTRLDRDVAVKVLPGSVSSDPDRRARFEREAKAVAALSHPNILAIHDFGVHDGIAYAVMELLRGETLRERLRGGPLAVRKASEIAVQIARGLAAAHDKGLLHRDLKPENLFLLEDGQVKILDFGLARQAQGTGASSASETVAAMTDPGTVLGTMGYMAPEQVRGQAVDARADLFAFGAVLYEMVSGQRAFQRDTAADTMTAILKEDPPELTGTRAEVSPALDRVIRHCLEKNPAERFQTARDVAFALGSLSVPSSTPSGAAPVVPSRQSPRWLITAALMALAAVIAVAVDRQLAPPPAKAPHFSQKTFSPGMIVTGRFMPDGQSIVYSGAATGNAPQLYEVRSSMLEARPIGPPRTHLLSVSSKGELAVLTDAYFIAQRLYAGTLSRMTIEGSPRPMMTGVREADWGPDGSSMAIVRVSGPEDLLEYPIGKVLYRTSGYVSDLRVSPDGTKVAFLDHQQKFDDRGWVRVVDNAGKVTTLAGEFWGEEGLAWLPDGSAVLFGANDRSNAERAVGDLSYQIWSASLANPGKATAALTSPGDFSIYDVSRDGRWLATRDDFRYGVSARLRGDTKDRDLSWLNQNWSIWLSEDGTKALFSDGTAGENYGVVWRKTDGSPIVQLGEGNPNGLSPDGRWAFAQIFTPPSLVVYPLGAGETIHVNTAGLTNANFADWFPDGKSVLITGIEAGKAVRGYRVVLPDGKPAPLLPEGVIPRAITKDGEFVMGFDAKGNAAWFPVAGGEPRAIHGLTRTDQIRVVGWARDGRSPLLQTGIEVPVEIETLDFATGKRTPFTVVSKADLAGLTGVFVYSMSPDGQQYAMSYQHKLSTLFVVTPGK